MTWDAYVFGDLSWPMPDSGLVAVWRAMSIDASRWDDWDGFVEATPAGTIAEFVDRVGAAADTAVDVAFELEVGELGVRLRACVEHSRAELWQRLAIAWRCAADLGASGQFAWVPGEAGPSGIAYRGVIADGESRWEKLTGTSASELDRLPGRREIDALVQKRGPRPAPRAKTADPAPRAKTADPAPRAKTADPAPRAREDSTPVPGVSSPKPTKKAAAKPAKPGAKKAKKKR